MINAFGSALTTAINGFVTDISAAIGSNLALVIPVVLGVTGIFMLWRIVSSFLGGR